MKITLIAAMDQNQLIGNNNALPWQLPEDLKFFKRQTTGKTLLMGRKTCESLPFPLPNRKNLVITRNPSFKRVGFKVIHDLNMIGDELDELMVIGGAKIYQLMLPFATHLILTKINHSFDGDTYFPKVNWGEWHIKRITNNPISENNQKFSYDFIFYERKPTG